MDNSAWAGCLHLVNKKCYEEKLLKTCLSQHIYGYTTKGNNEQLRTWIMYHCLLNAYVGWRRPLRSPIWQCDPSSWCCSSTTLQQWLWVCQKGHGNKPHLWYRKERCLPKDATSHHQYVTLHSGVKLCCIIQWCTDSQNSFTGWATITILHS